MFEDKYHEKHAQAEVLKERLRGIRAAVSVRVFLSSAGFGIAGFAPFFWSANNGLFWVCLILGAVIAIISNSDVIVGQVLSMFTSSDDQPDKYEDQ
jgi:O-antigen/teichoic acid export membrane protein